MKKIFLYLFLFFALLSFYDCSESSDSYLESNHIIEDSRILHLRNKIANFGEVQSSHIGHPILNDSKYGDKNFNKMISPKQIKRMALHSSEIRFTDQDGIKIHAKSAIDEAITILLDTLK